LGLINQEQCAPCVSDPKKECIADELTKEGRQCYQCVDKAEQCKDLGLLDAEGCRLCDAVSGKKCVEGKRTQEGKQCYSCQERSQACGQLGLLSALECEYKCTDCVEAQKAESGEQCFSCNTKTSSMDCLNNDYYRDCSNCKEGEMCEEVGVILFYENRKTLPLTCYTCTPK
jgi:hypothetical protein